MFLGVLNTLMRNEMTYDTLEHKFGNPLIHASSDWPISVDFTSNKNQDSDQTPLAQLQRPRSPVPAAIHERNLGNDNGNYAEVTYVPVATAGPCRTDCQMVMPFMVLLFFMTLLVAVTQVRIQLIIVKTNRNICIIK